MEKKTMTRRGFLHKAGQGLAAGAAVTRVRPARAQEAAPAEKKVGWALVGLGSLTQGQLLPAFANCKKSRLVALVSGHPDKAKRLAEKYGVETKNIYNYQNYDTLRNNPDVDVIYIVLPNGMHAEYTIRGAEAGKHILCEKPMANTPQECRAMIDACRKADRKLMIAYRCQYEPYNRAAIKIARDGEIGAVRTIVADHGFSIGDPSQWRLNKKAGGGGSLMDIGIYSLNAARYLTGEEPSEISAQISTPKDDPRFREVEADVNFLLQFPSGILANCTSSYSYAFGNRYRVFTTQGFIDMDPATSYHGLRMQVAHWGNAEEKKFPDIDQFANEMDHMSECVLENKRPMTPGEEGLQDLKLIAAIYKAAHSGAAVRP